MRSSRSGPGSQPILQLRGTVEGRERVFTLGPGDNRVGSHLDNELVLPFRGISRHHAVLSVSEEGIRVRDLDSRNGTFVEGQRVGRTAVAEGETLAFGELAFRVDRHPVEDVELGIVLEEGLEPEANEAAGTGTFTETLAAPFGSKAEILSVVERLSELLPAGETNEALRLLLDTLGARCAALVGGEGPEPEILAAAGPIPREGFVDEVLQVLAEDVGTPAEGVRSGRSRSVDESWFSWVTGRALDGTDLTLLVYGPVPAPWGVQLLRLCWRLARGGAGAPATGSDRPPRTEPAAGDLVFPEEYEPGESAAMAELHEEIRRVARTDIPVLIQGETGVGKEEVTRILHLSSKRAEGPLVAINCAAIPRDLLEAELFGIVQGAASGVTAREGRFRAAQGGTLLLDEIGELPLELQAKLLRALQEREVVPVGGRPRRFDVRLVTATNADLRLRIAEGRFRADLFYRVAGLILEVPPLRARSQDVPRLVERLLRRAAREAGKTVRGVTVQALEHLCVYPWPGNIRELMHEIRRLVHVCADGEVIDSRLLAPQIRSPEETAAWPEELAGGERPEDRGSLDLNARVERLERMLVRRALRESGGNRSEAARRLGISRGGLALKMKRLLPEDEQ